MKIFVIGREGQLARSLAELSADRPALELTFVGRSEVDLRERGAIASAISRAEPDLVINAAAYTNVDLAEDEPKLAFRINAEAASEAAEASASVGIPMIYVSTDYVFDGTSERPYREDDPPDPLNIYGASKLAGENSVRLANRGHIVIRTSSVVSPFGRNFVKSMIEAAKTRDAVTVVDDQRSAPTSALDLARAMLNVVMLYGHGDHPGLVGTYHVAGNGDGSWFEVAQEVMDECRRLGAPSAEVRPIPSSDWPARARRPRYSVLDCDLFERQFGYRLPDWRSSVAKIVKRLVAEGTE